MKFKQLTKKIFYEASQQSQSDKLEDLVHCYENVDKKDVEECFKKWEKVYEFYGSSELYTNYEKISLK